MAGGGEVLLLADPDRPQVIYGTHMDAGKRAPPAQSVW